MSKEVSKPYTRQNIKPIYYDTLIPYCVIKHTGIQYTVCKEYNHISRYRGLRQLVHNLDESDRFIALETPNPIISDAQFIYYDVPSREAGGLKNGIRKLSQVLNNIIDSPVSNYLKKSNTDTTPQCTSFSYWVDEPTMTKPGIIHYKSNAGLMSSQSKDILEYGTAASNILTLNGSYDGVAYNMTGMNFTQVGFAVDGSSNYNRNSYTTTKNIITPYKVELGDMYPNFEHMGSYI